MIWWRLLALLLLLSPSVWAVDVQPRMKRTQELYGWSGSTIPDLTSSGTVTATTVATTGLICTGTDKLTTTSTGEFQCATDVSTGESAHNFLSATHSDSVAASPTRGDVVVANSTPAWARFAVGGSNTILTANGTDPAWSASPTVTNLTATGTVSGAIVDVSTKDVRLAGLTASTYLKLDASKVVISRTTPIPVTDGGTSASTFTTNGVLYGATTNPVLATSQGVANSVLTANAGAPSFSATPTVTNMTATSTVTGAVIDISTRDVRFTAAPLINCSGKLFTDASGGLECGVDANSGGTVTSISQGTNMSFSVDPITTTGTVNLTASPSVTNLTASGTVTGSTVVSSPILQTGTQNVTTGQIVLYSGSPSTQSTILRGGPASNSVTYTLPTADGSSNQVLLTNGSGALSWNYTIPLGVYGDGFNGAATISSNTTLTKSMFYSNLTINSGITLLTDCYAIFVSGTLTNNGTISSNGGNGNNASGITGGTAASQACTTSNGEFQLHSSGSAGKNGGTGAGTAGGNNFGAQGNSFGGLTGGTGGVGGTGSSGAGGAAGTVNTSTSGMLARIADFQSSLVALDQAGAITYPGGGSKGSTGGSGGGDGTAGGGSGAPGASGAIIYISARTINNGSGTISSNGGNGGNGGSPVAGNRGGGSGSGGGSGGGIRLIYESITPGTITANAGSGGTGAAGTGTGTAGTNGGIGSQGIIVRFNAKTGVFE